MPNAQPGWLLDPSDRSRFRWWDGAQWTAHVSRDGRVWVEPIPQTGSATKPKRRIPIWVWVLIGVLCIAPLILLSPLVAPVALVVLITAIVGLSTGARTWLRLPSRRAAIAVTAGAAAVLLVTGSVSGAILQGSSDQVSAEPARFMGDSAPDESRRPTPSATPTPTTTTREEAVTQQIAFERTTVEDPTLPRGQTVVAAGQNGERTLTYLVTLVDGVETSRKLTSDVVMVQPVAEVTTVGTYDPPPPSTPECDSNYADACVPIASDVDCAGGSGDGPAYFDGVARVVGTDIYDLDRDGDGYACETW